MKSRTRFFSRFAVWVLMGLAVAPGAGLAQGQDSAPPAHLPKRLVADYGFWSKTQTPPYAAAQIPYSLITTINHANIGLNSDGTLSIPDGFLEPELLTSAHAAGVKVLVLLGGDPGAFSTVVADAGLRATLVSNLAKFIKDNHYDGVDVDWEFPGDTSDSEGFAELMLEVRQYLPSPRYLLSIDSGPWGGGFTPFDRLARHVDYFNIMMYDCAGPWTADAQLNSPIFWDHSDPDPWECQPGGSADGAMDIYLNHFHLSPSQLNMGTPFYGYYYKGVRALWQVCPGANPNTNTDCPDNTVFAENYGTFIKPRITGTGWVRQYDLVALVPYLLRADGGRGFITYDDPISTYARVWYSVWDRGLGGTFLWSLDEDYDGHSQDLLDAMNSAIVEGAP
jgi:chitinase